MVTILNRANNKRLSNDSRLVINRLIVTLQHITKRAIRVTRFSNTLTATALRISRHLRHHRHRTRIQQVNNSTLHTNTGGHIGPIRTVLHQTATTKLTFITQRVNIMRMVATHTLRRVTTDTNRITRLQQHPNRGHLQRRQMALLSRQIPNRVNITRRHASRRTTTNNLNSFARQRTNSISRILKAHRIFFRRIRRVNTTNSRTHH